MIIFVSTCIVDLVVDSWLSICTIGLIWCRVDISSIVCTDLRSVDKSTSGRSIVDEVDSNCSSSSWSEWSYKWSCSQWSTCCPVGIVEGQSCWDIVGDSKITCWLVTLVEESDDEWYYISRLYKSATCKDFGKSKIVDWSKGDDHICIISIITGGCFSWGGGDSYIVGCLVTTVSIDSSCDREWSCLSWVQWTSCPQDCSTSDRDQ